MIDLVYDVLAYIHLGKTKDTVVTVLLQTVDDIGMQVQRLFNGS